jgi:hypothetical protein
VQCHFGGSPKAIDMKLETVSIDTDARQVVMTWVGQLCTASDTMRISEITIDSTLHLAL